MNKINGHVTKASFTDGLGAALLYIYFATSLAIGFSWPVWIWLLV